MKETSNLKLKKPDLTDYVNIGDINDNMDVIDSEIKSLKDSSTTSGETINTLQTTLDGHLSDVTSHTSYGVATGTNNYAVRVTHDHKRYVEGMGVVVKIPNDSTANATLNVNGLGAMPIKSDDGKPVKYLKKGGIYTLRYTSSAFILQGKGGDKDIVDVFTKVITYGDGKDIHIVVTSEDKAVLKGGNGYPNGKRVVDLNGTVIYSQMHITIANMWYVSDEVIGQYVRSGGEIGLKVFTDYKGTELHRSTNKLPSSDLIIGYDTTDGSIYTTYNSSSTYYVRKYSATGTLIKSVNKIVTGYNTVTTRVIRKDDMFICSYIDRNSNRSYTVIFDNDLNNIKQLYDIEAPYII